MTESRKKGSYGPSNLPISKKYVRPGSRRLALIIGGLAGLAVLLFILLDTRFGKSSFLSRGPLSSNHANLANDCASCHDQFETVSDENCSICHEKFGDELGVYSFASHYLYRSGDFQRVAPSDQEIRCGTCHPEHNGRQGILTQVPDSFCLDCHEIGSFNEGHPQFAAVTVPENEALKFPHIRHIREVMKKQSLEDIEKSCLYCHNPEPDGKHFKPLNFDQHCDACHLTTSITTPRLAIRKDDSPGVLTLEQFRSKPEMGNLWSLYTNPNEFRVVGNRLVSKSPIYHKDPWIMENLRQLRHTLYPDSGLADLLEVSPDVAAHDMRTLYSEAIETLETRLLQLRSRPEPEIQKEIQTIQDNLNNIKRELTDPYAALDETKFLLALGQKNPSLDENAVAELEELVSGLTEPCRQCHEVKDAMITRVTKDQKTMRRAEYNHRTHILQRRCLDCHYQIPIRDSVESEEPVAASLDRASIQNLPSIEDCRVCHNANQSSNRCVTCHDFHPDQGRRSHLLLYLD